MFKIINNAKKMEDNEALQYHMLDINSYLKELQLQKKRQLIISSLKQSC